MKILVVTASRELRGIDAAAAMHRTLDLHLYDTEGGKPDVLYHGDCRGGDQVAKAWADEAEIADKPFPVSDEDWQAFGSTAGPRRNRVMLLDALNRAGKRGNVHLCAFPVRNSANKGTLGTVKIAHDLGLNYSVTWIEEYK